MKVERLCVGFQTKSGILPAIDELSFQLQKGKTFALVGESGSGKSLTALSILRLLPPAAKIISGGIFLDGKNLLALTESQMQNIRGRKIAMIFQEPASAFNPVLTIETQLFEVLKTHFQMPKRQARDKIVEMLSKVGIPEPEKRLSAYPFQLSGGMKQRAMIAMALLGEPEWLIADEPTTALDVTVQAQILQLLQNLQAQNGMGILLITHDLGVVAQMAHEVAVLYAGELLEIASQNEFFTQAHHPYSRALFAAIPQQKHQNIQILPGFVPAPSVQKTGCIFEKRCNEKRSVRILEQCQTQVPPWQIFSKTARYRCFLNHWDAPQISSQSAPILESESSEIALKIKQLNVFYTLGSFLNKTTICAVHNLNLEVGTGKTLALVGESGCGKTSTGKAILRLIESTGEIEIFGKAFHSLKNNELRRARTQIQMIFQDPFAAFNPKWRVRDILLEGLKAQGKLANDEALIHLLQSVGLTESALNRFPHEFSGGQRQRIAIARALILKPKILVLDEPTSALDLSVQAQILNLLKKLQSELALTYFLITHNFAVVRHLADSIAVMYLGHLVEWGNAASILKAPRHPYTQALIASIPSVSLNAPAPILLKDDIATTSPLGCPFHPRCPHTQTICMTTFPLAQSSGHHHHFCCHFGDFPR